MKLKKDKRQLVGLYWEAHKIGAEIPINYIRSNQANQLCQSDITGLKMNAPELLINSGAFWILCYSDPRIHNTVSGVISSYQSPAMGSLPPPAGPYLNLLTPAPPPTFSGFR